MPAPTTGGGRGTVSVCIPAYEAAAFIERTLRCAREQTYAEQRILVSVDRSEDDTEEICRRIASEDPRVEVHAHSERLGWAGNVNFLLDRAAETEFGFLYFHDDLIEPDYSERLVAALRLRPDAASAHCDVGHFGERDTIIPGRPYEGSAAERLLDFLTSQNKPSVLRSMTRAALTSELRLPTRAAGVWANQPFQMRLVAAGPALHVPDLLYRRWYGREGGLTDGWGTLAFEDVLAGYRTNSEAAMAAIDALDVTAAEREVLVYGLMVHMTLRMRHAEELYGARAVHPPEALHPAFAATDRPPGLTQMPDRLREQCERVHERLLRRTRRVERRVAKA